MTLHHSHPPMTRLATCPAPKLISVYFWLQEMTEMFHDNCILCRYFKYLICAVYLMQKITPPPVSLINRHYLPPKFPSDIRQFFLSPSFREYLVKKERSWHCWAVRKTPSSLERTRQLSQSDTWGEAYEGRPHAKGLQIQDSVTTLTQRTQELTS